MPTIAEYVAEATQAGGDGAEDVVDQLAQTLAAGDFALVVAAPQIPMGVQRVLEYLNARGQRLFGLEVSYFRGPVECFVPRLVVKPLISDPAGESASGSALDEETFLDEVPARCRTAIAEFLSAVTDAGADVLWRKYGPSITVTRGQQRQVAYIEAKRFGVTLKASADFPQDAFDQAQMELATIGAGGPTKDGWYYNVPLIDATDEQISTVLGVAQALVDAVAPAVGFVDLATATDTTFTRNDHNVWARHVPTLAPLQGVHLRGRLTHVASRRAAGVHLVPLANGQPGWRPRFESRAVPETTSGPQRATAMISASWWKQRPASCPAWTSAAGAHAAWLPTRADSWVSSEAEGALDRGRHHEIPPDLMSGESRSIHSSVSRISRAKSASCASLRA